MAGAADDSDRREREERFRFAALAHPLRQEIMQPMLEGKEMTALEMTGELDSELGIISYHVRVLLRRGALKGVARGPSVPALYSWPPDADWVRKMLGEGGEFGDQDP